MSGWQPKQTGQLPYSPVGTRAILINKWLDKWAEAYSARSITEVKSAVTVMETLVAPYLIGYWEPLEGKEKTKLDDLEPFIDEFAEKEYRKTIPMKYKNIPLIQIFAENPSWEDNFKQIYELTESKWKMIFLTRVIEDNELLGGGQDALTLEGFEPSQTP